jgi:hypothetical protein
VTVEDRLRATTGAVTAAMRPVRPLDLPPHPADARPAAKPSRARSPRRWPGWLVPVAAATAVIAVAATLVAVRAVSGTAPHGGGQPGPATSGAAANPNRVPAYYAAITQTAAVGPSDAFGPSDVTIAESATGKAMFTIKPPKNASFANVTAAADDRTFVVSVAAFPPGFPQQAALGWDLLRISPGATGYTLRRLSIPATPRNTLIGGLALSPDGTELAVMIHSDTVASLIEGTATLRIYSVATGQVLRTWQSESKQSLNAIGANFNPNGTVTWLANGHGLAFAWDAVEQPGQNPLKVTPEVRRLDLAKPGTGLLADSTPVVMITKGWVNQACDGLYPTADGNGAVCGTDPGVALTAIATCHATLPALAFRAYSGDGGSFRVLYTLPSAKAPTGKCVDEDVSVLWASPSGSTLVGIVSTALTSNPVGPGTYTSVIGVLAHGQWTPLPIHVPLSQVPLDQLAELAF